MVFWNALTAAALRARCACAMYKYRLLAAAGGFYPMEGRRVRFLVLIPVSMVLLMAYNARSQSRSTSAKKNVVKEGAVPAKSGVKKLSPAANAWVETTLRKTSVDEKIGQLLFTTYHGSFTATDTAAYRQIVHDVTDLHVGGFINITQGSPLGIVKSQAYPTAVLNNQLQAKSKLPLLVGADFERGTAMRLDEGTSFPTAMALAAGGNLKDGYTMGKITALEARAVGIHWIYAPDADVNNNPGNPIINTRSFGENPERVAQFVTEFVRGVRENGGLATAKHFPGHGDTAADSHIDLPVIRADRARLDSLELIPFRAAISAQVDSIMTGHLNVPALEPDPNTPATLSHNILTDLLRQQLGYQGLIVTDAMDMGGITVRYAPGEAAVRAVASILKLPPPDSYDVAILALFVRVSDRKGNVDVPAEQAALAEQIFKTGKPVITLGFGSPYLIARFPQPETWLAAFGISDVAHISATRAIFGAT